MIKNDERKRADMFETIGGDYKCIECDFYRGRGKGPCNKNTCIHPCILIPVHINTSALE